MDLLVASVVESLEDVDRIEVEGLMADGFTLMEALEELGLI